MLLRVKLLGKGTDKDPYRVALPDYSHIHGNITEGYAIVSVSEEVLGLSQEELDETKVADTTEGTLHTLKESHLAKVHIFWDEKRYKGSPATHRIEQV